MEIELSIIYEYPMWALFSIAVFRRCHGVETGEVSTHPSIFLWCFCYPQRGLKRAKSQIEALEAFMKIRV